MSALDDYDATAELKGRPTTAQRELAYAAAVTDRVLGAVFGQGPRSDSERAFERLAGTATQVGADFTMSTGFLVCVCADGDHAPRDHASQVFDTAAPAAREHTHIGASHVVRLRRMVVTTAEVIEP